MNNKKLRNDCRNEKEKQQNGQKKMLRKRSRNQIKTDKYMNMKEIR